MISRRWNATFRLYQATGSVSTSICVNRSCMAAMSASAIAGTALCSVNSSSDQTIA